MNKKQQINNPRIDGIQLLEKRWPSLTRRQITQLYEIASKEQLAVSDIKAIEMTNPMAEIGEQFGFRITLNQ